MGVKLRIKKLNKGRRHYYLDIWHDGERKYEFLPLYFTPSDPANKEIKELAENIRAKRELEISSGAYGFIPKHRQEVNFIIWWQTYVDGYRRKDIKMFKYSLEKFKMFLKLEKNLKKIQCKKIKPELCKQFKDYLEHDAGLSGETPADYFSRFKRVLNKAVEQGLFNSNPCQGITISKQSKNLKKEVLELDELRILKETDCGNAEVKRAFLFACFSGLGLAELRKLTWGNIYRGKLKIKREKTLKKGNTIDIDLHPNALKQLSDKTKGDKDGFIFSLPSANGVNKSLKNWMQAAGIEKHITFYCARHSWAIILMEGGANLKTVADMLGHSSTDHTIKYLNYTDKLKKEAIQAIPDL